jgi:hypothetical protein
MEGYPKTEDLARFGLNPAALAFGETHFFCFTHYVLGTRGLRQVPILMLQVKNKSRSLLVA